jgi:hypothetical protein
MQSLEPQRDSLEQLAASSPPWSLSLPLASHFAALLLNLLSAAADVRAPKKPNFKSDVTNAKTAKKPSSQNLSHHDDDRFSPCRFGSISMVVLNSTSVWVHIECKTSSFSTRRFLRGSSFQLLSASSDKGIRYFSQPVWQ